MNNRPIKFRTWLESENRFLDNKEIAETLIKFHLPDGKITSQPLIHVALLLGSKALGWTFQQFTGLKDSTGKEIYEGDIVSWEHPMEDVGYIKYITKSFSADTAYFAVSTKRLGDCHFQNDDYYRVIGNIFETPELLA